MVSRPAKLADPLGQCGQVRAAGAHAQRPQARPDLATIVGAVDGGFMRSLYVHDPDGHEVELFTDVPGWD
jgi:catechol 2,3-dioxygenase-like lactoylglutathione lyase family enzyme